MYVFNIKVIFLIDNLLKRFPTEVYYVSCLSSDEFSKRSQSFLQAGWSIFEKASKEKCFVWGEVIKGKYFYKVIPFLCSYSLGPNSSCVVKWMAV